LLLQDVCDGVIELKVIHQTVTTTYGIRDTTRFIQYVLPCLRPYDTSSTIHCTVLYCPDDLLLSTIKARQQCVNELGIKGWRKRRLMLEFERLLLYGGVGWSARTLSWRSVD
jgi:hypothetical protein